MSKKEQDIVYIAKTNFRGKERIFGIKSNDRRQHCYVIGKTGTGKTTLLENMVLQDIRVGRGVGIIDPHGEFVERILGQIPSERTNDVVYFNPVDTEYPIGFNVLEVPDQKYKHLVVSDLLGIFTKIWANVWSARMEYILQNCIMALLDTPGTTLLGIPRILVDKDYRQKIVANIKDPVVKSFWVHEYAEWRDQFRNEAIVPIQNKVNQFLNTSFIRNIVGQPKSTLNIPDIMNSGKILLVNVSKGKVGEDNAALLGAMIITKIQLAAMERVRIPEEDRRDFYLYVDEFQNFATDSFANILSEARKYRLNLIIAHQYVGQLVTDVSTKVRDAVFGNVGTEIVFRIGAQDAEFLEKEFFPEFTAQDLINLPNYAVYIKLMVDGVTSRPFSAITLPPLKFETDPLVKEKIIRVSRERYARPRAEVEEKINRWSGMLNDSSGGGEEKLFETSCWNCGKTASVPFKPDGKRPVYCLSCMKLIDEGKIVPLHERMPREGPVRYGATLADLGIEFEKEQERIVKGSPRSEKILTREESADTRLDKRDKNNVPRKFKSRNELRQKLNFIPRESNKIWPQELNSDRQNLKNTNREGQGISFPISPAGVKSHPVVRISQGIKPVSLSELKVKNDAKGEISAESEKRKEASDKASMRKIEVDTSALRKALEEALAESNSVLATVKKEEEKFVSTQPGSIEKIEKEEKVLKPGERVKF